jgi:hypothetical protein
MAKRYRFDFFLWKKSVDCGYIGVTDRKYSMTNTEMEELVEIIHEIEHGDDQIEPMHSLYVTVKRMIKKKRPELLKLKVYDRI